MPNNSLDETSSTDSSSGPEAAIVRPVIGIPVPMEQATWREWGGPAYLLSTGYIKQLRLAGAVPVLLPPCGDEDDAANVMARLDGLVLAGGSDIHPSIYRAEPHPLAGPFDTTRDEWESALVKQAMALDLPIMGICRGLHLLNAILGGSLVQHLPDRTGTDIHNPTKGRFGVHRVILTDGSRIAGALGPTVDVPTYHHQAVETAAPRLKPVGWAADGTIEALEDREGRILAVQWHPESAESNTLFRHFIGDYVEHGPCKTRTQSAGPAATSLGAQAPIVTA